ncbi:MAG: TonB-dependent receptor [Candidatus Marinimicrobia bacterium]|nr:TonB-dependent receptor [Candidatus Neomarinimicrobiota bacterium]
MVRRVAICLLAILLPIVLFAGTSGKIAGTIVDKQSGAPLAGVNVIVTGGGYDLGAATDGDGYYTIINVPVGVYTVRASYIGYKETVVSNLVVSLDLTTELNFELEQTSLAFEEVMVTALRPMIRKDATNTNIIKSAEEISNLPVRGMAEIAAGTAGVVKAENSTTMNIRGGRGGETATYIDGVLVNDPYNNAVYTYLPNEAIEEMSVQTGGFNAEYGDAMSGIVAITTNAGAEKYSASIEAITDGFLSADKKILGAYGYGYNEFVASLSGPIIPKTNHTFFLSGTRRYAADAWPSWGWAENEYRLDDYSYDQVLSMVDSTGAVVPYDTVTHKYDFNGRIPGNSTSDWSWNGKLKFQLGKNMALKLSYVSTDRVLNNATPIDIFNTEHMAEETRYSHSFNATLTQTLAKNTYYDLKFNYFDTERKIYDATFGDDLEKYGDPWLNPWPDDSAYVGVAYTTRIGDDYFAPGAQYDDYFKNRTTYWGIDFDIVHQMGKFHTFKAGFEYKYHTLREYRVLSPVYLAKTNLTDVEKYQSADVRFYGYDINGNEVDEGSYLDDVVYDANGDIVDGYQTQAPYHPIIMSGYIQDKIEFKDLVLNLGVRYDRIDPNAWQFKELDAEYTEDGTYIAGTGMFGGNEIFDKSDVEDSEVHTYLSPRLGVSFPVTDQTVFHAQYGQFYQSPSLSDLYLSPFYLDAFVSRGGYFTTLDNPNLKPPKTTSYEIGFKQMLGDVASLQLTAFYKETEDLIQVLNVTTDVTNIAFSQNGDFGNIKGLDVIFNLRRYKNLSASFNYELQYATGTGSASGTNFNIAWQGGARGHFPKFAMPLDFEQRHTGSLNVDYRFGRNDGPTFLHNAGANLMFSFNSGQPYTLMQVFNTMPFTGRYDNTNVSETPVSAVNSQTTPWVFKVDLKLDKKFYIGGVQLTAYAWVLNVLNTKNVSAIWITTGLPDDTGYLGTTSGQAYWNSLTDEQKSLYKMREQDYNNYGSPRQIRLGLMLEL